MRIPFLNLRAQLEPLRVDIEAAFRDIIDRATFICGKRVEEFERAFAQAHQAPFFLGTGSGTDALHLALWGLGIGPGDGVIVPVNTFIATAEAVTLCGATPIFVDCDRYFLIDADKVEEAIRAHPSRVAPHVLRIASIIPVHLYGQMADMARIMNLAGRYRIHVVEDACQAHLGRCRLADGSERYAGAVGDAGAFSFFPGKNLGAFGEAGGVAVRERPLYERMLLLRGHGSTQRYVHELPGHNYRMEELQAAVLSIKLPHLEAWTERRRELAARYRELLCDLEEIELPEEREGGGHVYHLFVVRVAGGRRDALRAYLAENGIDTGLHYPFPLHLTGAYAHLGYRRGSFPVAEEAARCILSLPMCPTLRGEQVEFVADRMKSFFAAASRRRIAALR